MEFYFFNSYFKRNNFIKNSGNYRNIQTIMWDIMKELDNLITLHLI